MFADSGRCEQTLRGPIADQGDSCRFGDGALSPLEGPMGREAYDRALEESVGREVLSGPPAVVAAGGSVVAGGGVLSEHARRGAG